MLLITTKIKSPERALQTTIDPSLPHPFRNLYVLCFLTISLMIGFASCMGDNEANNETPGDVVENFYRLVQNKEYDKAARMCSNKGKILTVEEVQKVEKRISWSAVDYENKNGIKEVIIIEETVIGDYVSAKVKYNIVYNNGDEDDNVQALEKINGKWYLKIISL